MNYDYDCLRDLCSDELYNSYKTDLDVLILKFGQNIMSDFTPKDYKIIRGTAQSPLSNEYVLTFVKGSNICDNEAICSNFGASATFNVSGKCPYCNSDLVKKSGKYVLFEKIIITK